MICAGYLSLSWDIFHFPIPPWFQYGSLSRAMLLVAGKSCLAQPNDGYISLPTAHAVHGALAHVYLLVHSSSESFALPTPCGFRQSGWGSPGRGQVHGPAAPALYLHSGEGGRGSAIGITDKGYPWCILSHPKPIKFVFETTKISQGYLNLKNTKMG